MVSFKPITIDDKEPITSFTLAGNYRNCDFSFANMCSWSFLYNSEYTIVDGFLLIRFWIEEKSRLAYMLPVGSGKLKPVLQLLEEDSLANGYPLLILGVTSDAQPVLEQATPGDFVYIAEPDYSDYIYLREDLSNLKGKKYQAKRNHINQFRKKYDYTYASLSQETIPLCLELEDLWYRENKGKGDDKVLINERRSLKYALAHYVELSITGGVIRVGDKIVAFTYGSPITHDTFGMHIEKADVTYEGIYALINQEFVSRLPEQYVYINREEDLGVPGLRKAKQSYHPAFLLEKKAAVKRPG